MKISEIRELSDEELRSELDRLRQHLFDLRSQAVTEKLEDPSMLTGAKRDIARIMTAMRERQQATAHAQDEQAKTTAEAQQDA
ncbi:MAG: 50S ribosomal protein L29 [Phycisphaerae bacterium]|nr:50S ribosomal protein L29 [Phycisphaerae bacterium]